MAEREKNQSIERAIAVLRIVNDARTEPNLSEIIAVSGLAKTIVLRIVSTLVAERMLERIPENGRYRLGSGLIEMAHLALARHPLLVRASGLLISWTASAATTACRARAAARACSCPRALSPGSGAWAQLAAASPCRTR